MADSKTRLGISAYAVLCFIYFLGSNGLRSLTGWGGFLGFGAALLLTGIILFIKIKPERFRWYRIPQPLFLLLLLMALSLAWSQYRFETFLGVLAQLATTAVAVILSLILTWHELLRTLGTALRYLLGISLLFELFVAIFVQHPLLQGFITVNNPAKPSKLLYWSRDLLFSGGPIQGIVANSAMLGFLALLGLIIFTVQVRGELVRPVQGWFWIFIAVLTLALTRSATVFFALFVVIVTTVFVLWTRRVGAKRAPVYLTGGALLAATAAIVVFAHDQLFALFGKSSDLTGRAEIWDKVISLTHQYPAFGWGWISYWAPWVEPYASLDTKVGIPVMHAHSAWLDVRLQLGWVGVVLFTLLILLTLQRVWCRAVDQPRRGIGAPLPYAVSALFPMLIFSALLTQSLTESRLLIEGGWLLLVIFATKTRIDYELPSAESEPTKVPWRKVPIPQPNRGN